jgi:hypothetical protein
MAGALTTSVSVAVAVLPFRSRTFTASRSWALVY